MSETYGESSPSVGLPLPLFSAIYGRYAKRSYGFMAVGRADGVFFSSLFIFFSLFVESAMSHPLETYEPDRPPACVFFASNARENTRRTTLGFRVITEMKVPGKTGTGVCGCATATGWTRRLYKSNDDDFIPDIGSCDGDCDVEVSFGVFVNSQLKPDSILWNLECKHEWFVFYAQTNLNISIFYCARGAVNWNTLNVDNSWKMHTKFGKLTSFVMDPLIGFGKQ